MERSSFIGGEWFFFRVRRNLETQQQSTSMAIPKGNKPIFQVWWAQKKPRISKIGGGGAATGPWAGCGQLEQGNSTARQEHCRWGTLNEVEEKQMGRVSSAGGTRWGARAAPGILEWAELWAMDFGMSWAPTVQEMDLGLWPGWNTQGSKNWGTRQQNWDAAPNSRAPPGAGRAPSSPFMKYSKHSIPTSAKLSLQKGPDVKNP